MIGALIGAGSKLLGLGGGGGVAQSGLSAALGPLTNTTSNGLLGAVTKSLTGGLF